MKLKQEKYKKTRKLHKKKKTSKKYKKKICVLVNFPDTLLFMFNMHAH